MGKNTQRLIVKSLLTAGIPSHYDGYSYLKQSIQLCIESREVLRQMVKRLYPEVGQANGMSPKAVERSMRNAIKTAWNNGKLKNLEKEIGVNLFYQCPTTGEFIGIVSECISLGLIK